MTRALAITIVLAVLIGALAGTGVFSVLLTEHEIAVSQHHWCQTLQLLTSRPVPRPAHPGTNPSREESWVLYSDFLALRGELGCG